MKKTLIQFCILLAGLTAEAQQPDTILTSKERSSAVKLLNDSKADLFASVKNLRQTELDYKPSPERWSIGECVKHIAAAETELWAMAEVTLKQAANPEKRINMKFTDDQLIAAVRDRSKKNKTFAALEPANSPYKTVAEALEAFRLNREKLIAFVKLTRADLRGHVLELPLGTYDTYQFILLIAAHTDRHIRQLLEVKADPNFPKN